MPTTKETLAEVERQLKIILSLLAKLKGNTPKSMLADYRLRYVKPLQELIVHLRDEVRKQEKQTKPKKELS